MWRGSGAPSDSLAGGGFHYLVLALGLAGLVAAGAAAPLGGAPDRAPARRHQRHRRAAAGRHAAQPAGDAARLALAGVTVLAAVRRVRARSADRAGPEDGSRTEPTRHEAHPVPQRGVRQGEGARDRAPGPRQDGRRARELQEAPAGPSEGDQGSGQGARAAHQAARRQGRGGDLPGPEIASEAASR